jgi:hypothetical protein
MKGMEFMMIGNHPVEEVFVERGQSYKEVVAFLKEIHQEAINDDQTSISKQSDWIICQYMLLQKAAIEMKNKLEELE